MSTPLIHTIEQVKTIDYALLDFLHSAGHKLNAMFSKKYKGYDFRNFDLREYARNDRMVVCKKGDKIIGFMLSRLSCSIFDPKTILYVQDLIYTNSPKATSMLFKEFIDFGKLHADHILTVTTPHTNIKRRSLERLGFVELETSYRMEIKR